MTRALHVGMDVRMWHNTGIGRYIRALVRELPALGVRLSVWGPPEILAEPALADTSRRTLAAPLHSLAEQLALAGDVPRSGVDLFHAPHLNMPLLGDFPRVATLHDLIPLHHPDTLSRAGRLYFRLMALGLVPRRARRILANSEWTKSDLVAHGVSADRIVAIPLGVDEEFFSPPAPDRVRAILDRLGIGAPYILYAGQRKPYKNLDTLIEAFARLVGRGEGTSERPLLVLLGRTDPAGPVRQLASRLGISRLVVEPGYLPDEAEVRALFAGARAFAFPSRCEGFGLPPLEAMASGVPVVCATGTGLAEAVGPEGLQVDPDDVLEWSQALEQVLFNSDFRHRLIPAGRRRAELFRWPDTARRTLDVYTQAL